MIQVVAKRQVQSQRAKLAMSVAGNYRLREIYRRNFESAAEEAGLTVKALANIVDELANLTPTLEHDLKLPRGFPEWLFACTINGIKKQVERMTLQG